MFEVNPDVYPEIDLILQESPEGCLTIFSSGAGCGGPFLKLAVQPPLEDDLIVDKEGYSFHVRRNISPRLEGAVVELKETFWGKKININYGNSCLG